MTASSQPDFHIIPPAADAAADDDDAGE